MEKLDFVHLHLHTEYSLLDGFTKLSKLFDKVKSLGMKSVAITDHGVMFGVIDFYKKAKKAGVKPIIGCEVYTAARSRKDKDPNFDKRSGHLVLLAENEIGYRNLTKLVSLGFTEGFYYKPRIDYEILEKYSEGLIGLSACLAGEVQQKILKDNYEGAKELALRLQSIFKEGNFFLELQDHGIPEQRQVNEKLIQLSKETNIPLVATNDSHYVDKEDEKTHEILLCVQTGKTLADEHRMEFGTNEFYLKSPQEMYEIFKEYPEALENTVKIAERCNVDFDFDKIHLPRYEVPADTSPEKYLRNLCEEGLVARYGENPSEELKKRLEYEMEVIETMGYGEYFLIVWDFIDFAKKNKIMVGPGRGSAAGSIVSYVLGITDIDPIKYNLLFERFLNPERISMPDIDIDFCYERREEVIDYVKRKYGDDHVAQIITFGTLGARAAVRDVGRVLGIGYTEVDRVAKEIPFSTQGMSIDKALEQNPKLREMYEKEETTKELLDISKNVEGLPRHASTHAAGVVISKEPVDYYVPLYMHESGVTTQFPMTTLEELGLLKMDFLGLRTLTVIQNAIENIKRVHNIEIDFSKSDYEDEKVYELLSSGNTLGVFQLESAGMRQFMKELKASGFEDIVAGISLYRPGPMDSIPTYVKNKNNMEEIEYIHPSIIPILNVTYGCIVYQEQVMQIVRDLGGYTYGRSDLVRRAMGKKKMDVMEEERKYFVYGKDDDQGNIEIRGCVRNGIPEAIANKIFDDMIDFAKYAFNKSHAAAYGVLAYQTAYLKAHYPVEFMAALMTSVMGNTDKVVEYIRECSNIQIEVLNPDINKSHEYFTVENNAIRFGLGAVKNVGVNIIRQIAALRESSGEFKDFIDFCQRADSKELNKRVIESLIKCGAFDSLVQNRASLMAGFEKILDSIHQDKKKNIVGQISLFSMGTEDETDDDQLSVSYTLPEVQDFDERTRLALEKDVLGMYVTGHPLNEFVTELERKTSINTSVISQMKEEYEEYQHEDNKEVIIGGMVAARNIKATRNNDMMAFLTLEDLYGTVEIIVFPRTMVEYAHLIQEDKIILIRGRLSLKEDEEPKIIAQKIMDITKENDKSLYLRVKNMNDRETLENIKSIVRKNPGQTQIIFYGEEEKKLFKADASYTIGLDENIIYELQNLLGKGSVKIK